jgi:hypothetical protein
MATVTPLRCEPNREFPSVRTGDQIHNFSRCPQSALSASLVACGEKPELPA